jgi:hypothetical protein
MSETEDANSSDESQDDDGVESEADEDELEDVDDEFEYIDEEDDDEPDDSKTGENFPCPYCDAKGTCRHVILYWSACGGDWSGTLVTATAAACSRLQDSLLMIVEARGAEFAAQRWDDPLHTLVHFAVGTPTSVDEHDWRFETQSAMQAYLYEFVRWDNEGDKGETFSYEWASDGGGPGTSDSYGVIYARDPDATIAIVRGRVEADVEAILRWANLEDDPAE